MSERLLRLFVGLPLPQAYQEGLSALMPALRRAAPGRASWTAPGNWHLTIRFLGNAAAHGVEPLCAALGAVAWRPFAFRAAGGGCFPSCKRPGILWAGVQTGARECLRLAGQVGEALRPLGFIPEVRPFTPHLTVARIRSPGPGQDWQEPLRMLRAAAWPEIVMDTMVLWHSALPETGQQKTAQPGPRYIPVGEFGASG